MPKTPETNKVCHFCGRSFEWRKSMAKNWEQVKYCSKACRSDSKKSVNKKIEDTMLALCASRASICPSEVAREMFEDWRDKMQLVHAAARRLSHEGSVKLTKSGVEITPDEQKGPYRIITKGEEKI